MIFALAAPLCLLGGCTSEPPAKPAKTAAELAYISDDRPVAKAQLDAAIAPLFEDEDKAETRAVIVMANGKIIAERYGPGFDEDSRFISWSVAKTITATLIGFMVSDGRLVLDDPAPVPSWQTPGNPNGTITLRDLIYMSSGLEHREGAEDGKPITEAHTIQMLFGEGTADMAQFAEERSLEAAPGEQFEYSSATSVILSDIMTRTLTASKNPQIRRDTMDQFIHGRLLEPLDMDSAYPEYDANGTFIGGSMFHATARDYAKFGEFLRHRGSKKGAQHLPVNWFDFMLTSSPNDPAYGAHIWLNKHRPEGRGSVLFPGIGPEGIFGALGHLGQYIIVSPKQKLTIVRFGKTQDEVLDPVVAQLGEIVRLFPVSG